MSDTPRFAVVAPMLNEADNVEPMAREIAEACAALAPFEAIFVNDGSTDGTADAIASLRAEDDRGGQHLGQLSYPRLGRVGRASRKRAVLRCPNVPTRTSERRRAHRDRQHP